mgnify:CR=1 FL=1
MHGLGAGTCSESQQVGVCENTECVEASEDMVVCVSSQFLCVWTADGVHARVPCMYLAPATSYHPHIAIVDGNTFAVSIGSTVEFSELTGGRALMDLPCCGITTVSKGPGKSALVTTDLGAVWHVRCTNPGTAAERTRTSRLFSPCVIHGRATGPATCAAYDGDLVYYYGTTQGLYRESINDYPVCLVRGYVACVVSNAWGTAAVCNDVVCIMDKEGTVFRTGIRPPRMQPRLHLFRDLVLCGPCTINMHTLQISCVHACEYAICSNGSLSHRPWLMDADR